MQWFDGTAIGRNRPILTLPLSRDLAPNLLRPWQDWELRSILSMRGSKKSFGLTGKRLSENINKISVRLCLMQEFFL